MLIKKMSIKNMLNIIFYEHSVSYSSVDCLLKIDVLHDMALGTIQVISAFNYVIFGHKIAHLRSMLHLAISLFDVRK